MRQKLKSIVENLTQRHQRQRKSDDISGCAVLFLLICGISGAAPMVVQPPGEIEAAAEAFLQQKVGHSDRRTTVRSGEFDSRHQLPLCSRDLEAFMRQGAKIAARTIVGVRCTGSKPWKVYLPVDVIVSDEVLVARRSLPRGHLLTRADLVAEERDVSRLIAGYIANPDQLIGQRLKHQLIAGRIITPAMLRADRVIRRGQTVTLTVQDNGLSISVAGRALVDGAIGQRIRVENINSGRVIEGIVRSPEHVEILVYKPDSFFNAKPKVSPIDADTKVSNNDR